MKKILLMAVVALMTFTAPTYAIGFRAGVNAGYVMGTKGLDIPALGVSNGNMNSFNFDVTGGVQALSWLYAGVGAGVEVFTQTKDVTGTDLEGKSFPIVSGTPVGVPLFAEVRFSIPLLVVVEPFLNVRGGYVFNVSKPSCNWKNYGLIDLSVGVELFKHLDVSVGYNGHIDGSRDEEKYVYNGTASGFVARVGYRF
ncbi:MAG: outer membrane beta-barrel protein [Bacteroidaceae bacterium]|nr:outer membrane beta-barrel protein [Bacteroidaceae bacterium]